MKSKLIGLVLFFTLINTACRKTDPPFEVDVSGITETDIYGNLSGYVDYTDWTRDNSWSAFELNLFETPTAAQLAGTETADIVLYPVYPNPLVLTVGFSFNTNKVTLLQLVITDKLLNIKYRTYLTTQAGSNNLLVGLDATKYINNSNYRLYYCFYSLTDGQFFKGHGDLQLKW